MCKDFAGSMDGGTLDLLQRVTYRQGLFFQPEIF